MSSLSVRFLPRRLCFRLGTRDVFAPASGQCRRRFSAPARASLPLDGFRVLDMTRVLAGVWSSMLSHPCPVPDADLGCSHTVRRSSVI
jgi:hypothetical protein